MLMKAFTCPAVHIYVCTSTPAFFLTLIGVREVKEVSKSDKQLKKVERRFLRAGTNITK